MAPSPIKTTLAVASFLTITLVAVAADPAESDWEITETSMPPNQSMTQSIAQHAENARIEKTPFRRRIMREDITVRIKTLRLESGEKVSLVHGSPKGAKDCPAVFVLDVESNVMATATGIRMPTVSERKSAAIRQAAYLTRSPFGSNMLGNGFAVAYVVGENLEAIRSARTNDWIGIFNRVRDLRKVDDNNVFLFSTREYANLSVYLASRYNFSGFILEEPSYMLFSRDTHEDVIRKSAQLSSDEIWQRTDPTRAFRYLEVLSRIRTPIMLIRNPRSEAYTFNEKTLIPKLLEANAYFETVEIDGSGRALTSFGGSPRSGVIEYAPEVTYHAPTVSKWVEEMLTYMKMNSTAEAVALRDPANYRNW